AIRDWAPSPYWPAGGFVYEYTCVPVSVSVSYTGPIDWGKGVGWRVWFKIDNPDDFGDWPGYFLKDVTVDGIRVEYLVTYDNRIKIYGFTSPEGTYTAEFLWKDDIYETRSRVSFTIPPGEPIAEFVSIDVPSSWPPGTSFSAKFRVKNAGSWEERIWVRGYYNETYLGEESRQLGPGEEFEWYWNITMPDRDIVVTFRAGHADWEDVVERRTVRVSAPPPPEKGTIYGVVKDSVTGKPIAGVSITANGYSTSTDETGYYEIEVEPDTYTVTASKSGYEPASRTVTVYAGTRTECNFELKPIAPPEKGTIYGYVKDSKTMLPIPNATITINGYTTSTNSAGYYEIEVPAGTYTVSASKSGYRSESRTVTVGAGEMVGCNFLLEPVPTPPPEKGIIYGTVRDVVTREPLSGVTIKINGYTAVTDTSGYYEVEVMPDTYTVTASKTGYEPASRTVTVKAGEKVECSFELRKVGVPPPWWEELIKYAPYIALGVGVITVGGLIAYEVTKRGE
ncbi:MAG: hypothetical protein DRJ03_29385, partial [Chloroflexi bacterium]